MTNPYESPTETNDREQGMPLYAVAMAWFIAGAVFASVVCVIQHYLISINHWLVRPIWESSCGTLEGKRENMPGTIATDVWVTVGLGAGQVFLLGLSAEDAFGVVRSVVIQIAKLCPRPPTVAQDIVSGLEGFVAKLESGEPIETTRIERIETPDGPMHVRTKGTL